MSASLVLSWLVAFGCLSAVTPARSADLAVSPPAPFLTTPKPFFVRLGFVETFFDTGIVTRVAGVPITGNGTIGSVPSAAVEAGVFVAPHVSISVGAGFPPVVSLWGTGALASQGVLFKTQTGVVTLTGQYHFDLGPIKPYIGGGVGYAIVFRDIATAIIDPSLRSNAGWVAQTGVDYALTDSWGLYLDFKKVWLKQDFTGLTALAPGIPFFPVSTRVRSDPMLLTTGVSYRF
jgi:outer membrane protein